MINSFAEIINSLDKQNPPTLAVVNPIHEPLLNIIKKAQDSGWIKQLIFKDENPSLAAQRAVKSVRAGAADLLIKGDLKTDVLLKQVLNKKTGLRINDYLSHIAVLESSNYELLMLMTDGGVNIQLDEERHDSILNNALFLARCLNINRPNVAYLSLSEGVSKSLPDTFMAELMVEKASHNKYLKAEGPMAPDVAWSAAAAELKGINSEIAGKVNIFIGPNISAVNFTVKSLVNLGEAKAGGIILGAECPIILLSRSDTEETKLNSIALGLLTLKGYKNGY